MSRAFPPHAPRNRRGVRPRHTRQEENRTDFAPHRSLRRCPHHTPPPPPPPQSLLRRAFCPCAPRCLRCCPDRRCQTIPPANALTARVNQTRNHRARHTRRSQDSTGSSNSQRPDEQSALSSGSVREDTARGRHGGQPKCFSPENASLVLLPPRTSGNRRPLSPSRPPQPQQLSSAAPPSHAPRPSSRGLGSSSSTSEHLANRPTFGDAASQGTHIPTAPDTIASAFVPQRDGLRIPRQRIQTHTHQGKNHIPIAFPTGDGDSPHLELAPHTHTIPFPPSRRNSGGTQSGTHLRLPLPLPLPLPDTLRHTQTPLFSPNGRPTARPSPSLSKEQRP